MVVSSIYIHPEDKSSSTKKACLALIELAISYLNKKERFISIFSKLFPGSNWSSTAGKNEIVKSGLSLIENGNILIIHFDSDVKWSNRNSSKSFKVKLNHFQELRSKFKKALVSKRGKSSAEADEILENLIPMIPFRNFESWSYFNKRYLSQVKFECEQCENERIMVLQLKDGDFDEKNVSFSREPYKSCENENLIKFGFPLNENFKMKKSLHQFLLDLDERLMW